MMEMINQKSIHFILLVSADQNTLSANDLSKYWIDARDVLENLDDYQALWIKIHGCV